MPKSILRLRGDEELAARSRDGDERAFELLYERHVPGMLSFCRHMLSDSAEAEDAVQHTFAAMYRELRERDRPLRVKAWLYTVARNRCLSLLRDRRERPRDELELSTRGCRTSSSSEPTCARCSPISTTSPPISVRRWCSRSWRTSRTRRSPLSSTVRSPA